MSPSPNSNVTPRTGFCMDLVLLWFFVSTIYIYTVRKFCIQAQQHYRLKLYYVFRHKLKKTTKTTKFRLFWYPIYISIRHSNAKEIFAHHFLHKRFIYLKPFSLGHSLCFVIVNKEKMKIKIKIERNQTKISWNNFDSTSTFFCKYFNYNLFL